MTLTRRTLLQSVLALPVAPLHGQERHREVSGVYPHLAMFNGGMECGTGAVVPWAGRLWVVTYSPHSPLGSDDKLYEIDESLHATVRPESIGGTPANRMIHTESNQLFIGPYAIDANRKVRAIPYRELYGRPTGNARHLTAPAGKIYYASMEEGLYEVDVHTLAVKELYEDGNRMLARKATPDIAGPLLPGYHGKGLYSGQGRLIYSNNGEYRGEQQPPSIPSGCLAEWDGTKWTIIRRNQFTEVTGPGDIKGNARPESDPVWSVGWDHRSVLLMLLDGGQWHTYRLPKASHTYDGAHGWNTEWPRIRDVGDGDLLMTMHGMFWRFPRTFSKARSAGVVPRSTYLRVIGDFARWGDRIAIGCDDTARSEFTNKRKAKGAIAGPGQSQSNLWFVRPDTLDRLGTPIGRGAVWLNDSVRSGDVSDAYLFAGFTRRMVHIAHGASEETTFTFEVDRAGNNRWQPLRNVKVPAAGYAWASFDANDKGAWIRARVDRALPNATVFFQYSNEDRRTPEADPMFAGLAKPGDKAVSGGLLWARGDNKRTLLFAARLSGEGSSQTPALYEFSADLILRPVIEPATLQWIQENVAIPGSVLQFDAGSVIYTDEAGNRWRLPKGDSAFDVAGGLGNSRVAREVSTERDLFNAHGTFYELPAENAGGIAVVRPICTHNRRIHDYCSYRGLMVVSGLTANATASDHIVRSEDGRVALWVGVSDDLWKLGKPRGQGGPWHDTPVQANQPSEPYLMTGYDRKQVSLSHAGAGSVPITVEVDLSGTGMWRVYRTFDVPVGRSVDHEFPDGFAAYWVRTIAGKECIATAQFRYQ
jgi:hypothetical protein